MHLVKGLVKDLVESIQDTVDSHALNKPVAHSELNLLHPQRTASQFRKSKLALLKLKGNRGTNKNAQLIALLHGPGGSGKSTVINMVTAYAQSFCASIGHPFTNRTIVITAMSGVAATLLHGETTHSGGSIVPRFRTR